MENRILEFTCAGLKDGETFPLDNTGRGRDLSPEFVIQNLSPKAKTVAIVLQDLSHPLFKKLTHWVIWNLPAGAKIAGSIPPGKQVPGLGSARQGLGYGWHRYAGPKPPRGTQHRYRFTLYSLDCELGLGANATRKAFLKKAEGHILQSGSVTGKFE